MAASYKQLKDQIAKLEREAAIARKKEAAEVILKIKALMRDYDLTPEDLGFKTVGKTSNKAKPVDRVPIPPKYRDPQTGNTWSGRGSAPSWIAPAIKSGKAESFLIVTPPKPAAAAEAPAKAKTVAKKIADPVANKKATPAKKHAAPAKKAVAKPPVAPTVQVPAATGNSIGA